MRYVVGGRAKERTAASTSLIGRFETEIQPQPKNLELLTNLSGQWVDKVHQRKHIKEIILDMDSSDSQATRGQSDLRKSSSHRLQSSCLNREVAGNNEGAELIQQALSRAC